MLDAISMAVSRANLTNSATTATEQVSTAATSAVTNARAAAVSTAASATAAATATVATIKSKLPVVPDPTLIKKQAEAEAQLKITQAKETALKAKEKTVAAAKAAAAGAAAGAAAAVAKLVPKLPAVDPKLVAGLAAAKQIKDLAKQRKAESLQNLAKNKDAFKFPLTPASITAQLPKIPPLPLQAGAPLPERSVPEFDKFQLPIRLPS